MEDYKSDDLSTKGVGVDLSHLVSFGLYQPSAGQYETIFNAFLEIPEFFLWNYYSNFFFCFLFHLNLKTYMSFRKIIPEFRVIDMKNRFSLLYFKQPRQELQSIRSAFCPFNS